MRQVLLNDKPLKRVIMGQAINFEPEGITVVTCLHDERIPDCNNLDEINYPYKIHIIDPRDAPGMVDIYLTGKYKLEIISE